MFSGTSLGIQDAKLRPPATAAGPIQGRKARPKACVAKRLVQKLGDRRLTLTSGLVGDNAGELAQMRDLE